MAPQTDADWSAYRDVRRRFLRRIGVGYCVGTWQVHVKSCTRTLSRNTLSPIG
jgi:hypothetical protein